MFILRFFITITVTVWTSTATAQESVFIQVGKMTTKPSSCAINTPAILGWDAAGTLYVNPEHGFMLFNTTENSGDSLKQPESMSDQEWADTINNIATGGFVEARAMVGMNVNGKFYFALLLVQNVQEEQTCHVIGGLQEFDDRPPILTSPAFP